MKILAKAFSLPKKFLNVVKCFLFLFKLLGTKILKTLSHVNVIDDECLKSYCSNCLKLFSSLYPCEKCSIIRYCSEACQNADRTYHAYECQWVSSVIASIGPHTTHLNLPSRSQRFLLRFVSHLDQSNCETLDSDLISNVDKICSDILNSWEMEAEEVLKMVPILASRTNVEQLIRFFGILKSNSYMIKDDQNGNCIGAQLIDLHSRVNHSCEPNCVSSYVGTDVFLIALRDISVDEEITVSYTDSSKPRNIRRNYLKTNLFFDCNCHLCTSDEFSFPEAFRTAVLCSCGAEVYNLNHNCPNCDAKVSSISESEGIELIKRFKSKGAAAKVETLQDLRRRLCESHWICNEAYDLLLSEFSVEVEFARGIAKLLINYDTFNLSGSETQFNPYIILQRYEYLFSIINLHSELHPIGVKLASSYLPFAIGLKGFGDELTQKIGYLIKKWSN